MTTSKETMLPERNYDERRGKEAGEGKGVEGRMLP